MHSHSGSYPREESKRTTLTSGLVELHIGRTAAWKSRFRFPRRGSEALLQRIAQSGIPLVLRARSDPVPTVNPSSVAMRRPRALLGLEDVKVVNKRKCHDQVCMGTQWIETSKMATCSWDGNSKDWIENTDTRQR